MAISRRVGYSRDLAKSRKVRNVRGRTAENDLIEGIEGLEPQFRVEAFFDASTFRQAYIRIAVERRKYVRQVRAAGPECVGWRQREGIRIQVEILGRIEGAGPAALR